MGSGALGAAEDGPQIVRVGQLVANDNQGSFSTAGGLLQDIVNGVVHMGGCLGNHTLVGVGEGHGVQLPPVHRYYHRPGLLGLGGQTL